MTRLSWPWRSFVFASLCVGVFTRLFPDAIPRPADFVDLPEQVWALVILLGGMLLGTAFQAVWWLIRKRQPRKPAGMEARSPDDRPLGLSN